MLNKLKCLFIAFSVIFIQVAVFAEKSTMVKADPFPGERPGQYVYYHDMRTGIYGSVKPVNRLIGIMKADNKQYIIRACNISNGESFLFLGHFYLDKGGMDFFTDEMQGDAKEGSLIMADLLNLMKYMGGETSKNLQDINNRKDITVASEWSAYKRKLINSYRWWIPFYKLESSSNAETDSSGEKGYKSLKLVCFGSVLKEDPDMFTRISKLPVFYNTRTEDKKYIITETEGMNVKLDNIPLALDKNWHFEKGDLALDIYDTYELSKFTSRDAQIGIESIELKNMKFEKNDIDTFTSSLMFQSCVIADTVKIDLKNRSLSLSLWDADSETSTFTCYTSLGIKNNLLIMLNFSALDFIYYANMDYFNRILNINLKN